jgi:hypothetical protein
MPIEVKLKSFSTTRTCRRCHKPTLLIHGTCEECLIDSIGRTRLKERPKCREEINRLLKETPELTLCKIAFWMDYDTVPIIPSDGIRSQAKLMLREERKMHK